MTPYDQRTALLVVDVQNDFGHPKGSLYVRGGGRVVGVANREIRSAKAAGALIPGGLAEVRERVLAAARTHLLASG